MIKEKGVSYTKPRNWQGSGWRSMGMNNRYDDQVMNTEEIKTLYNEFLSTYNAEETDSIWKNHSSKFQEFWNNKITNSLNRELDINELLINLASNEYSAVINKNTLKVDMISPVFKDFKNGQFKIISFVYLFYI